VHRNSLTPFRRLDACPVTPVILARYRRFGEAGAGRRPSTAIPLRRVFGTTLALGTGEGACRLVGAVSLYVETVLRTKGCFTLGGLLAGVWRPAHTLLPWAFSSAMLTTAAMWDYWQRGGPIDYVVLGLAAYELMMGLMEEPAPQLERTRARVR
jgi:hypothetical protein